MYYLDELATTKLTENVKNKIIDTLDCFGNPSSVYDIGLQSRRIIDDARDCVYKFINADIDNSDVIFTSGGSASNTLAIKGVTSCIDNYILYYSPIAHKSMLLAAKSCKYSHKLHVNKYGCIDIKRLKKSLESSKNYKPIVCIDVSNSEIGTIQNIKKIINIVHKYNGIVIGDCTSYIPMHKVDVQDLDIDIIAFSGHKLHALKGIGVLYKKKSINLSPLIYGSQENGLFAGTENIIGICSLGEALKNYSYENLYKIYANRNVLLNKLSVLNDWYLIGSHKYRLPNNIYICIKGVDGQQLVSLLDINGIQVSTGSACNNGSKNPSNTLKEIKLNNDDINSCIRITVNEELTYDDIDYVVNKIIECINFLRGD